MARLLEIFEQLAGGDELITPLAGTVDTIMTLQPRALTLDHTIEDSIAFLQQWKFRHIPVVELEPKPDPKKVAAKGPPPKRILVGVISQRDLARVTPPTDEQDSEEAKLVRQQLVSSVISRPAFSCKQSDSIYTAIQTMISKMIDCLPVVENRELVGIVTATDIMRMFVLIANVAHARVALEQASQRLPFVTKKAAPKKNSKEPTDRALAKVAARVEDVLVADTPVVDESVMIANVVDLMTRQSIRHVLVKSASGGLVGVVSSRDILRHVPVHWRTALARTKPAGPGDQFYLHRDDPDTIVLLEQPVSTIMTRDIISVLPGTPAAHAAALFIAQEFAALPVVSPDGRLVGLVTQASLMSALVKLSKLRA